MAHHYPPVSESLRQRYSKLSEAVDEAMGQLQPLHQHRLRCAPGCSQCCIPFSVLAIEAALLQEAFTATDRETSGHTTADRCALLAADLCCAYASRPLICRTQGMPLGYVDHERQAIEVSACPLNFPQEYILEAEELLFMDQFNEQLMVLNEQYCAENNLDATTRIAIVSLI